MTNQSKDEILKLSIEVNESMKDVLKQVKELIAENKALKESLAQPAQKCPNIKNCDGECFQCEYFNAEKGEMEYPVVQPAQDPMAWTDENVIAWCLKRGIKAAKDAPPQYRTSTWVGLTNEEIKKLSDDCVGVRDETEFIRAIEQSLKEKNT